jgi:hypothetical protein
LSSHISFRRHGFGILEISLALLAFAVWRNHIRQVSSDYRVMNERCGPRDSRHTSSGFAGLALQFDVLSRDPMPPRNNNWNDSDAIEDGLAMLGTA